MCTKVVYIDNSTLETFFGKPNDYNEPNRVGTQQQKQVTNHIGFLQQGCQYAVLVEEG